MGSGSPPVVRGPHPITTGRPGGEGDPQRRDRVALKVSSLTSARLAATTLRVADEFEDLIDRLLASIGEAVYEDPPTPPIRPRLARAGSIFSPWWSPLPRRAWHPRSR